MIDMTNFKKSVKWYDENLATLLPQYRGRYVGVCIDKVCGSWDDQDVGFDAMVEAGYTPGEFIVHRCLPLGAMEVADMLIGMDVISMGDFQADQRRQDVLFDSDAERGRHAVCRRHERGRKVTALGERIAIGTRMGYEQA